MPQEAQEHDCDYLSNHCLAMRKALQYCLRTSQKLSAKKHVNGRTELPLQKLTDRQATLLEAQRAARSIIQCRHEALKSFLELVSLTEPHESACDGRGQPPGATCGAHAFPTVKNLDHISPSEFRRTFQHANLPCKIEVLPRSYFGRVDSEWVMPCGENAERGCEDAATRARSTNCRERIVNRSWFLQTLGAESTVPVRLNPRSRNETNHLEPDSSLPVEGLDDEGRAAECETVIMTIQQWIALLQTDSGVEGPVSHQQNSDVGGDRGRSEPFTHMPVSSCYLKDWHLQSLLKAKAGSPAVRDDPGNNDDEVSELYRVPPHFGRDLLNRFLSAFFASDDLNSVADYYFCYWGPRGSKTMRHSDVLNSFSWSYNVCGHKEWTFYPPSSSGLSSSADRAEPSSSSFASEPIRLSQKSGQCVFVPSGWHHSVVNYEETLSVNHNWITTANIDLVWSCLCQEMKAIEHELAAWDSPCQSRNLQTFDHANVVKRDIKLVDRESVRATDELNSHWDVREAMLRGCVGLDVTAFFLMVSVGIIDLVSSSSLKSKEDYWGWIFDLTRLSDVLQVLLQTDDLNLLHRLEASLGDQSLSREACQFAEVMLELVNTMLSQ